MVTKNEPLCKSLFDRLCSRDNNLFLIYLETEVLKYITTSGAGALVIRYESLEVFFNNCEDYRSMFYMTYDELSKLDSKFGIENRVNEYRIIINIIKPKLNVTATFEF